MPSLGVKGRMKIWKGGRQRQKKKLGREYGREAAREREPSARGWKSICIEPKKDAAHSDTLVEKTEEGIHTNEQMSRAERGMAKGWDGREGCETSGSTKGPR